MKRVLVGLIILISLIFGCEYKYNYITNEDKIPQPEKKVEVLATAKIDNGGTLVDISSFLKNYGIVAIGQKISETFTVKVSDIKGITNPIITVNCESSYWLIDSVNVAGDATAGYTVSFRVYNTDTFIPGVFLGTININISNVLTYSFAVNVRQAETVQGSAIGDWPNSKSINAENIVFAGNLISAITMNKGMNGMSLSSDAEFAENGLLCIPFTSEKESGFYQLYTNLNDGYFAAILKTVKATTKDVKIVLKNLNNDEIAISLGAMDNEWHEFGIAVSENKISCLKDGVSFYEVNKSDFIANFPIKYFGVVVDSQNDPSNFVFVEKMAYYNLDFSKIEVTSPNFVNLTGISVALNGTYNKIVGVEMRSGEDFVTCNKTFAKNGFYSPQDTWKLTIDYSAIADFSNFTYMEFKIRSKNSINMWMQFTTPTNSSPFVIFKTGNWVCSGTWNGGVATGFEFNENSKRLGFLFDIAGGKAYCILNGALQNSQAITTSVFGVGGRSKIELDVGGDGSPTGEDVMIDYIGFYKK